MRQDDRGITLVEIIIAITVAAIVVGVTTLFIQNAINSYVMAADTIDVQVEAQVLMEQVSTWVMEGNYVPQMQVSVGGKDAYIIYHIPHKTSAVLPDSDPDLMADLIGERWMRIIWCNEKGKLYMYMPEEDFPDPSSSNITPIPTGLTLEETADNLIGEHVKEFAMELDAESPNMVEIELVMTGTVDYEFYNEINMKNKLYEPQS